MKDLLSYDDVYLRPKYSELNSRSDADTSVEFLGKRWKLPVIPANMQDVISWDIASGLQFNKYFYVMHRFGDANQSVPAHIRQYMDSSLFSISLGVNDESKKEFDNFLKEKDIPNVVTIDVAQGHHKKVGDMIKWILQRSYYLKSPSIIAGNVATVDGYKYLCDLGVDAVKVGIGGGSICSTKFKTGFHIPTFQSVLDIKINRGSDYKTPIIADGGIKHNGDIAKALVAGATMVMCGGLFASCIDSPAKIVNGKKFYRGSTSYEAKGKRKHIEGVTLELDEGFTYVERLMEIQEDLSSAISYAGGKDLSAFQTVEWGVIH